MAKKSASKKNGIHPHIRVTDAAEIKLLDNLKKETHERTYSGALMRAASLYFVNQKLLTERQELIRKLQTQLQAANEVIESSTRTKTLSESYTKQYKIQLRARHVDYNLDDDDLD